MHNFAHFGLDWISRICGGEGEIHGKMVSPLRSTVRGFCCTASQRPSSGAGVGGATLRHRHGNHRPEERERGEEPGAVDMADRKSVV